MKDKLFILYKYLPYTNKSNSTGYDDEKYEVVIALNMFVFNMWSQFSSYRSPSF